jgi:hypothetical protein
VHVEKIILGGVGQGSATALNTWFATGMELVGLIGYFAGCPSLGSGNL